MAEHTKLPWQLSPHGIPCQVCGPDRRSIANADQNNRTLRECHANAAFIVTACNCHKELVAALEVLLKWFVPAFNYAAEEGFNNRETRAAQAAKDKARAVLATVRGEEETP